MRWNQIIGRDVVDTSNAESLGTVDGFVIDPDASAVVAILVGGQAVSWSDADGIGRTPSPSPAPTSSTTSDRTSSDGPSRGPATPSASG